MIVNSPPRSIASGHFTDYSVNSGPFRHVTVPNKALIAATFTQSFLFHAIVRVAGAGQLKSRQTRMLLIMSYLTEMYQAIRLLSVGALTMPDASVFIIAPVGVVLALLAYPEDDKDKKQ